MEKIVIIIRGLPGSGKTSVAKRVAGKINATFIWVDKYKLEADNNLSFEERCRYAYKKTAQQLEFFARNSDKYNYIVIEEIFYKKPFIQEIKNVIKKYKMKSFWFRIEQPIKYLLEIENKRKRAVKNSYQDFIELKKKIVATKVKNETIIWNKDIKKSVEKILAKL